MLFIFKATVQTTRMHRLTIDTRNVLEQPSHADFCSDTELISLTFPLSSKNLERFLIASSHDRDRKYR